MKERGGSEVTVEAVSGNTVLVKDGREYFYHGVGGKERIPVDGDPRAAVAKWGFTPIEPFEWRLWRRSRLRK